MYKDINDTEKECFDGKTNSQRHSTTRPLSGDVTGVDLKMFYKGSISSLFW